MGDGGVRHSYTLSVEPISSDAFSFAMEKDISGKEDDVLICIDTQEDLKRKIQQNKQSRKKKRLEKEMIAQAQLRNAEKRQELLDAIEERKHALHHGRNETPLIVPGSAASKMAYGRKETHAYSVDPMDRLMSEKERLPLVADIGEEDAMEVESTFRESLGLKNFGDHFLPMSSFAERRPESRMQVSVNSSRRGQPKTATVSIQGESAHIIEEEDDVQSLGVKREWSPNVTSAIAPLLKSFKRKRDEEEEEEEDAKNAESTPTSSPPTEGDFLEELDADLPITKKQRLDDVDSVATTNVPVKGKVKKAAPIKFSRSQIAVAELSGKRDITADEAQFLFAAGENKTVKPKHVRFEYLTRTETPPSGNASIRAARRSYMTDPDFASEAERGVNQGTASVPSTHTGALKPKNRGDGPTVITAGLEVRHIAVIDEEFFEPDEPQKLLLRQGDKLALDMAKKRYQPSMLPRLPIEDHALRALEQGRSPNPVSLDNARLALLQPDDDNKERDETDQLSYLESLDGDESKKDTAPTVGNVNSTTYEAAGFSKTESRTGGSAGLPLVSVKSTDARQPLYRYFEIYGKTETLVTENIVEELVFDSKRVLFNFINREQLYERDLNAPSDSVENTLLTEPAPRAASAAKANADANNPRAKARVNANGMKVMHKNACQRARNIKRQREPVGRQAESEPQRLRARISDTRVEFFLERWNCRDRFLAIDHPELVDPSLYPTATEEQIQRERGELLKRTSLGVLGQIMQRHRNEIKDRGKRTGTNYSVSSEDLGTSRLHPSANPSMCRIKKSYRESYMEQPRYGELGCGNEHECYCYKGNIALSDNATYLSPTNTSGFVCKQFLFPHQDLHFKLTGELPATRQPCIICKDCDVTRTAYDAARNNIQPLRPIHDHCVYTNVRGEYDIRQCLPKKWSISGRDVFTGIVDAYPLFNANDYLFDIRVENGVNIRFLRYHPPRSGF